MSFVIAFSGAVIQKTDTSSTYHVEAQIELPFFPHSFEQQSQMTELVKQAPKVQEKTGVTAATDMELIAINCPRKDESLETPGDRTPIDWVTIAETPYRKPVSSSG